MPNQLRQILVAVRAVLVLSVLFGVIWPLAMTGWALVINHDGANGSLLDSGGKPVASSLLAQDFSGEGWFHARPSSAGEGYDAMSSGGSNLAPTSEKLLALVDQRREQVAKEEDCDPSQVPPDALSASASGLDPHISPAYAELQAPRVAKHSGLPLTEVNKLIDDATSGGVIAPEVVNVVTLNAAIAAKMQG